MDTLDIAKKLISFDTINPPGTNKECAEWIRSFFESHDIKCRIHEFEGISNVVAELDFGPGKTFCLNGHIDVVPTGKGWSKEPFTPVVEDDKLYGRGACDMKSGVACLMKTMLLLKDADIKGRVILMLVGDEETGGFNGTKRLVEEYKNIDYVVVGEGTNFKIKVARRGVFWVNLKIKGKQCHAARPEFGKNPIEYLGKVITKLTDFKFNFDKDEITPDPNLSMTVISGGDKINTIPGEVNMKIDMRHVASQSPDSILSDLKEALNSIDGLDYELEGNEMAKPFKAKQGKLLEETERIVSDVIGTVEKDASGGSSDIRFFNEDTESLELGVRAPNHHGADEFCYIEDLQKAVKIYYELITKMLS